MVSTGTIIIMSIVGLTAFLLSFLFILILRRWFEIQWIPIIIGAVTFIIFAMVLEQISHFFVLGSEMGEEIPLLKNSPWLYVLYGVLAAGVFEETGRLVAFLLMKRRYRKLDTAISYGIGHGGVEAMILLGLGMVSAIVFSILINSGSSILDGLPAGALEPVTGTANYMYVLSIVERVFAISVHIGLSVIVWVSVMEEGKWWLFPVAIILHALTNLTAGMFQSGLLSSIWMVYIGFIVMTAVTLWVAYVVGVKRSSHRRKNSV
ncbi:YhfC family intramembrane metalloprotease [Salinicoccus luteus]|uniref:YhfC family intramembrane metalloprotease n=1 Tax=Salinicoccus luteus TaxID=367840 RepID=UPI00068BA9C0|nr:YhfC family glutamic-type intramembrane protease [Salinicoccus luteus]